MNKGRITIPTDENFIEQTKEIAEKWGADAIRNCDGTKLPQNALNLADKVYQTYFVVRGDNEWAKKHLDELQNVLLMSEPVTAFESILSIDLLNGFFREQLKVNDTDYQKYWQVFDRTTNEEIFDYFYDKKGNVIIPHAKVYHEYTVNFFAYNIWDSTQMYNYITNHWSCEKHMVIDPRYNQTFEHIQDNLKQWCQQNQNVNVVRFTTFLYHFFLIFNQEGKEKLVDWFGYAMTASPKSFEAFKEAYGYEIKTEDLVRQGTYSNHFVIANKAYRDYQEFTQKYVAKIVRILVDIVHAYKKEAMMFLGDSWIGTEPYGKYFKTMNLDAVVGSVGSGTTVRMLSEIPSVKYREGRLLPYFFPDTFFDGNEQNAIACLNQNWLCARRAMMRKPLDRIGFGGYLSLAKKFPNFIQRVSQICDEFRKIYDTIQDCKPYTKIKVGILNAYGKLRSWQCYMVAHELWYQQTYSYQGILEALSGLPIDVEFLSFEEIRNGIPVDIDVLINAGDKDTAFSGGSYWEDQEIICRVKEFVANGGGIIGVGEPSAISSMYHTFKLADVFGVDEENSMKLSYDRYNIHKKPHFITEDVQGDIDYGEGKKNIYAFEKTEVLDIRFLPNKKREVNVGEVMMATNHFGKGRSVYITGLPYSMQNARILLRSIYYAAHQEENLKKCFSDNINTDCSYYEKAKMYAIINNTNLPQQTVFYDKNGHPSTLCLKPLEICWIEEDETSKK